MAQATGAAAQFEVKEVDAKQDQDVTQKQEGKANLDSAKPLSKEEKEAARIKQKEDAEAYERQNNPTRYWGLGSMQILPDKLVLEIFSQFTDEELMKASYVSKAFYIFSEEDEHWKPICLRRHEGKFIFKGTWKRTALLSRDKAPTKPLYKPTITGFHSDFLYARWYRGHTTLTEWKKLPENLPKEKTVDRRSANELTVEQFIEEYASKNRPVIITDLVTRWGAWNSWKEEQLIERIGKHKFKIDEPHPDTGDRLRMRLQDFFTYCKTNNDEDPLYIFCPKFGEHSPTLLSDYDVPDYFREDFMTCLTPDERPFYRWVVIGCPRSGSPFHLDPYKTSAWNALLAGRKRWALYPPGWTPPGLTVNETDSSGVPESYSGENPVTWYLEHYPQIMSPSWPKEWQPIECIQEAGELIFVPSMWWHQVLNLEESIAVTQNFCDRFNLPWVYEDMKEDEDMHVMFTEKMLVMHPELMKSGKLFIPREFWDIHRRKRETDQRDRKEAAERELTGRLRQDGERMTEAESECFNQSQFWKPPLVELEELKDSEEELHDKREKGYNDWSFWRVPLPGLDEAVLAELP